MFFALLAAVALATPGTRMTLDFDALVPGETLWLKVNGAPPGVPVTLVRSLGGPGAGPCRPTAGVCLDVLPGIQVVGTRTADAYGTATFYVTIPALPSTPAWWQAVALAPGLADTSEVLYLPIATPCIDDAAEDDDTTVTATLGTGTFQRVSCRSDDDVWRVPLPVGHYVEATVTSDFEADGAVFAEISLGANRYTTTTTLDSFGSVAAVNPYGFSTTADVSVYMYPSSFDNGLSAGVPYTLTLRTAPVSACDGSEQEPDSSFVDATVMQSGDTFDAHACGSNPDYVAIDAQVGDALQVDVTYPTGQGHDLSLSLYDSSMTQLGVARTGSNPRVSRLVTSAGRYYARVAMVADDARGGGVPYTLTAFAQPRTPCPVDAFEPNDTAAAAVPLASGTYAGLGGCTTDAYDWYRIDLLPWQRLEAYLPYDSYDTGDGVHSMLVVDSPVPNADIWSHRVPNAWNFAGGNHVVSTAPNGGTWYIVVWTSSDTGGAVASYLTSGGNAYDLVVDIR